MRVINEDEIKLVSGAATDYETMVGVIIDWWDSVLNFLSSTFDPSNGGQLQTVVISATRMTEAEKNAFDLQALRSRFPMCEITMEVSPDSTTTKATLGVDASGKPSGSIGYDVVHQSGPKVTYKCPPNGTFPSN